MRVALVLASAVRLRLPGIRVGEGRGMTSVMSTTTASAAQPRRRSRPRRPRPGPPRLSAGHGHDHGLGGSAPAPVKASVAKGRDRRFYAPDVSTARSRCLRGQEGLSRTSLLCCLRKGTRHTSRSPRAVRPAWTARSRRSPCRVDPRSHAASGVPRPEGLGHAQGPGGTVPPSARRAQRELAHGAPRRGGAAVVAVQR